MKKATHVLLVALAVASIATIVGCSGRAAPTISSPAASQETPTQRPITEQPLDQSAPQSTDTSQAARWAEFVRYGTQLADLQRQSIGVHRGYTDALARLPATQTAADLRRFSQGAGQAGILYADLKLVASRVQVPDEATAWRDSVAQAFGARADALNKIKTAAENLTDMPPDTWSEAERAMAVTRLALASLCGSLGATNEECAVALGWPGPNGDGTI